MKTAKLHELIAAVCPIQGVSIGDFADKGTWVIHFDPSATAPQRAAADAVVAAFDVAAEDANEASEEAKFESDAAAVKSDNALKALVNMSPSQIDAWAAANITNLAEARSALVKLAKIVSILGRRVLK